MENRVVVHMRDGVIHKGVTQGFDPSREAFYLLPAEGGGVPLKIRVEEMKALFYVKDYLGNRDFTARQEFDRAKREGKKAILTFFDDERLWGTIPDYDEERSGFFFYPVDEEDNNIRIYVVRSSLKNLELVP